MKANTHMRMMFPVFAAAVMLAVAFGAVVIDSEDVNAGGTGSKNDPLDSLSGTKDDFTFALTNTCYVYVGSEVNITGFLVKSTTTDPGLKVTKGLTYYSVSGEVTKVGKFTINHSHSTYSFYGVAVPEYTYTLEYNNNGGTGGPKDQTITTTSTYVHFTIPDTVPTRTNYTFVKWNTDPSGLGTSYCPGYNVKVTNEDPDRTLYAIWKANSHTCYLYYNANGGSGAPSTQSYTGTSTSNHTFTISDKVPTRDRYNFVEWNTNSSGTGTSYSPGSKISVGYSSSLTLYAIWEIQSYIVSFDSKGGSLIESQVIEVGNKIVPPDDPELYGYIFAGWFTDDGTFLNEFDFNSEINNSITLHAKWTGDLKFTTDPISDGDIVPVDGQPGTVSFKATASKDYTSLVWDFGDGSCSTNTYATHFYSQPGTYVAKLTVFNNHGSDTTEYIIEVPEMAAGGGGNDLLLWIAFGLVLVITGGLVIRRLL